MGVNCRPAWWAASMSLRMVAATSLLCMVANNTTGSASGTTGVTVNSGATLGGNGTVDSTVIVNSGGTVALGESAGQLAVEELILLVDSTFAVELTGSGGVAGTDFDQLVAGSASIGGNLTVSLLDSFEPDALDSFTVLTAMSLSGNIGNVTNGRRLDTMGGEGSFLVHYNGSSKSVVLSDFMLNDTGLAGDFNGDWKVDSLDFIIWQRYPSVGNLADWQGNYGAPFPIATYVPELYTSGLLLVGVGRLVARRSVTIFHLALCKNRLSPAATPSRLAGLTQRIADFLRTPEAIPNSWSATRD